MAYVICHTDPKTGRKVCGWFKLTLQQAEDRLERLACTMPDTPHWKERVY